MASGLIEIEDAQRLVLDAVTPLACEPVELPAALGRVLGEDVSATEPVPAFDNSAMDGFAVRAQDVAGAGQSNPAVLHVVDESRAGSPAAATLGGGEAVAISTGAVLPAGADAVVRVEDTRGHDGRVEVLVAVPAGTQVRHAGDDVRSGQTVLERGALLGPAELGVLASLGGVSAQCVRRPRLSLLVSGDELLAPGEPSRPGAIRDSNSLAIAALARCDGAEVVSSATVSDDADATTSAIAAAVQGVEVTVICGGVSVGVHDHVKASLRALGAQTGFWGLSLKPGRPAWFGTLGSTLVFGLPGNPVSAMVTFVLLVRPALRTFLGLPPRPPRLWAVIDSDYEKPPDRAHALRCRITAREDGWHAQPTGAQGSHVLTSMLGAEALAFLPTDTVAVHAGERVEVEPLHGWIGAVA
jgi:molybdopterin molybdotransferase